MSANRKHFACGKLVFMCMYNIRDNVMQYLAIYTIHLLHSERGLQGEVMGGVRKEM